MKILVLANHYNTLRIFRRELLIALANAGHQVIISIPPCDDNNRKILESYGARVLFTPFDRRGMNPLHDLRLLAAYKKLIHHEMPDKVITYTIKCNIYGGIACKCYHIPHYANITGLGSAFQSQNKMRMLVSLMYRFSLNRSERIFFENTGNRDTLVSDRIVRASQTVVLPGAGVNLSEFSPTPYPSSDQTVHFLLVCRIMQEKGIDEYFHAIKKIRSQFPHTVFDFIGWYEDNYETQVKIMEAEGFIHFHGFQMDVKPFIAESHCVVLPSWHEGMSNTLLESAAMCRPLITSRIHGCMEAVEDGISGYLTTVRDEDSLVSALSRFIQLPYTQKVAMGQAGRQRMKHLFDKNVVVDRTIKAIFTSQEE